MKTERPCYQGLLVEIGRTQEYKTYVPPQDKNRTFGNQTLDEVCDITRMPEFGYERFLQRAKTVDVIWFNRRDMPAAMFEVEMSTDMLNSLTKFNELRDFHTQFCVVAPSRRRDYFLNRVEWDTYYDIRNRIKFMDLDELEKIHIRRRQPIEH